MARRPTDEDIRNLMGDIESRQRNTIWPDTVRNGRSVDAFLWHGSPDASLVQRIGVALFGLAFFAGGVVFLIIARHERSFLAMIMSAGVFFLAVRMLRNAVRRRENQRDSWANLESRLFPGLIEVVNALNALAARAKSMGHGLHRIARIRNSSGSTQHKPKRNRL